MIARLEKGEEIQYISHLDYQRLYQRALRRADLPIAYSQGFNPHPNLAFAMALSLGYTSRGEYLDIAMAEEIGAEEFQAALNRVLPPGAMVLDACPVAERFPALTSLVERAQYLALPLEPLTDIDKQIGRTLGQDSLVVEKKTKSGVKPTDIRPLIFRAEPQENGLLLELACSSSMSLSPGLFLKTAFGDTPFAVSRLDLLSKGQVSLMEYIKNEQR